MRYFEVPYGKRKTGFQIDETRVRAVLIPKWEKNDVYKGDERSIVADALASPAGTPRLRELARGKKRIVVIASDHTRPVPSRIIMPLLLEEIRSGNPDADITILIATGCHRGTRKEELIHKFGSRIVQEEKIVIHDCDAEDELAEMGRLPSGGRLIINRLAAEADLLVAEGFIEPHFFAGFSGGRKSVLPGVAGRESVLYNHNAQFIDSARARTGILDGNPVHTDMVYAAEKAGLAFIVNVVLDADHHIVYCAAGDFEKAHRAGTDWLGKRCAVRGAKTDIVVVTNGGYPLDQNIYQAVKGMTAAEAVVKDGGVIIMAARSEDGHGGRAFYETFSNDKTLEEIMDEILSTPSNRTKVDQWQSQVFCRVLMKASVVYVSDQPDDIVKNMRMIPAHSIEEALEKADQILGTSDGSVTVIPDGVSVIVSEVRVSDEIQK